MEGGHYLESYCRSTGKRWQCVRPSGREGESGDWSELGYILIVVFDT